MPVFNNRRGNGGTGKGILTTLGHRREAIKAVKNTGFTAGYTTQSPTAGVGAGWTRPNHAAAWGGAVGDTRKKFSAEHDTAVARATAAGVSPKKINKVSFKAKERGFAKAGQDQRAAYEARNNPFS